MTGRVLNSKNRNVAATGIFPAFFFFFGSSCLAWLAHSFAARGDAFLDRCLGDGRCPSDKGWVMTQSTGMGVEQWCFAIIVEMMCAMNEYDGSGSLIGELQVMPRDQKRGLGSSRNGPLWLKCAIREGRKHGQNSH